MIRLVVALLALCAQGTSHAEVYKCPGPDGSLTFSDRPCADGAVRQNGRWVDMEEKRQRELEAKREREQRANAIREHQRKAKAAEEARQRAQVQLRRQHASRAKAAGYHSIEYAITGPKGYVNVTYKNGNGGSEQHRVALPWHKRMTVDDGFFAYVSAQKDGGYGALRVQIYADGLLVKQSEATSRYGIATASGRL